MLCSSSFTSLCHILVCHGSTFNKNGERETLLSWTFFMFLTFHYIFFSFYSFYTSIITLTLHLFYIFFSLFHRIITTSISCFLPIIFSRVKWPFMVFFLFTCFSKFICFHNYHFLSLNGLIWQKLYSTLIYI